MSRSLSSLYPDPEQLLKLSPEELGLTRWFSHKGVMNLVEYGVMGDSDTAARHSLS